MGILKELFEPYLMIILLVGFVASAAVGFGLMRKKSLRLGAIVLAAALTLTVALGAAAVGIKYYSNRVKYENLGDNSNAEQTNAIGTTESMPDDTAAKAVSAISFKDNTSISAAPSSIVERLNKLYEKQKDKFPTKEAFAQEISMYTGEYYPYEKYERGEGISKGDTVLTDGEYIYKLHTKYVYNKNGVSQNLEYISNSVEIINAKTMKKAAQIKEKSSNHYFVEMYLSNNLLTVLESNSGACTEIETDKNTVVRIYDVSNKSAPKLRSEYAVTGTLISSLMVDDVLYTVTSDYIYVGEKATKDNLVSFLPTVESNGDVKSCAAKDVYLLGGDNPSHFTSFSALNTKDKSAKMNIKSMMSGFVYDVYYTGNSAYLFDAVYQSNKSNTTEFIKLNFSGDKLYAGCKFTAEGYVSDSNCMSERNGFLRVVAEKSTYNGNASDSKSYEYSVYVFDKDGKNVGSVTGLGDGNNISSVRFYDDMCYCASSFAVDLSNPKKPTLISDSELPDYTNYLYSIKGFLVGVGNNSYGDPKISLFSKDGKRELDAVNLDRALIDVMKAEVTINENGEFEEGVSYNVHSPAVNDFNS
ncbi:MAG: beta-propeller domain-containing protein, partial [Acutalibacteraceae bacterium]